VFVGLVLRYLFILSDLELLKKLGFMTCSHDDDYEDGFRFNLKTFHFVVGRILINRFK
jgi:hypothetical protein